MYISSFVVSEYVYIYIYSIHIILNYGFRMAQVGNSVASGAKTAACPGASGASSSSPRVLKLPHSPKNQLLKSHPPWWVGTLTPPFQKLLYFELSPPWHLYVLLLANLLAFCLAYLLAFYLAYLLQYVLAYLLALYLAYLLAFYLAVEIQQCTLSWEGPRLRVQRCTLSWEGPRLRSSGAHWAGKVPGWGPAVHTELGRSQVEVQRCTLSWFGPRLRSSGAHWAGKLAKSLAKSWQGGSWGGSWCRHGRGETGGGGEGGGRGGGGCGGQLA